MTEDSIDFQPMPGEETENGLIRHLFRVPVNLNDDIQVTLGTEVYSVSNLSATGIAVNAKTCFDFTSGQIIENAELKIEAVLLTGLRAKVIHCSVDDSGSFQFGVQWLDMNQENQKTLEQTLVELKARALASEDPADGQP